MTSPGGRIEIRVDPDLTGFNSRLGAGLSSAATSGIGSFVSAAKVALAAGAVVLGGAAVLAAKSTLDIGIEYQNQLNTLQAVSGATADQMRQVGQTAKELGSDLTLPATSAADAAAVMTELAKANFTVDQAQRAAKGSLQLAAAAQIDGARAAEIQANAINAFSLSASDATRVADVLANAANASSAEITDIADALSQASAVAAAAGIPIEDVATSLGILANNGIKGSDAGTLVKSALLALQSPSKQARDAMADLNLEAYDAQGNFVGLRSIFEQLQTAQQGMTAEQYAMATSTLFGSDAARLAGIAAKEGGEGFDVMAQAIGRQGAAADVAAAKSKGLGGAIEAFKSQVETVQIDIFERAAPSLERYVRLAAERLPEVAESALDTADRAVAYLAEVGPGIVDALQSRAQAVENAWDKLASPILDGAKEIAPEVLDVITDVADTLSDLGEKATDKLEPLADAVGDLVDSLDDAGGPLETTGTLLGVAADGAGLVLDAAGPLVGLVSTLVSGFSQLPGPVQSSIVALAALKLATSGVIGGRGAGAADGLASPGLGARMSAPFREFADTVRVQMALADDTVSRSTALQGGIGAALDRQVPQVTGAWREIAGAYRGGVAEAAQLTDRYGLAADGFVQKTQGIARATQTAARVGISGLTSAGSGLVSFLGGPWGAALAGGTLAVSAITSAMAESEQRVQTWADAFSQGGQAAATAMAAAQADDGTSFWEGVGNLLTDDTWSNENVDGFVSAVDRARQASEEYRESLSPLQRAQLDVQRETNDLALAVERYGAGSPEAIAAAGNYQYAQNELAQAQRDLALATADATDRMSEQVSQALGAADANLQLSNAQIAVRDAEAAYAEVIADSAATDDDRARALNSVTQAALNAAAAAGQKAAADATGADEATQSALSTAAQITELDRLIAAGGPATAQLQAIRDGMGASSASAVIASAALDSVTGSVERIPGERAVRMDAQTATAEANLRALGFNVEHMPDGSIKVTANTADAEAALNRLTVTRTVRVVAQTFGFGSLAAPGAATGGKIRGPGTGTSDTAGLWALSNNEWVIRARSSETVGDRAMSALNSGDWRTAAARLNQLAQSQSAAQLANMAATRAASAVGRAAAGGYVRDELRAQTATAVSVPTQQIAEVVGMKNLGPVYYVDPEAQARQSRQASRAAANRLGVRRGRV